MGSKVALFGGTSGSVASTGVNAVVGRILTFLRQYFSSRKLSSLLQLLLLLLLLLLFGHRVNLGVLRSLLNAPVEHVVILEALAHEQVSEELAKVRVVGLIIEAERSTAVEVDSHLRGEAPAKKLSWSCHLLLHDSIVLLLLGGGLKSLPRQRATEEVHEHISQRLEVISSRLLNAEMCVDGSVTSSASQVLVLSVRDVQMSFGVSILLGQTKINDIDLVASFADAHEEVVRLDISVDKVSRVNVLDSRNLRRMRLVTGRNK